jgi:hypothetical protein
MRLEATSNARVDMLWLWLMPSIMRLTVRVRVNVFGAAVSALKHTRAAESNPTAAVTLQVQGKSQGPVSQTKKSMILRDWRGLLDVKTI